jgi:hypothetical protein
VELVLGISSAGYRFITFYFRDPNRASILILSGCEGAPSNAPVFFWFYHLGIKAWVPVDLGTGVMTLKDDRTSCVPEENALTLKYKL